MSISAAHQAGYAEGASPFAPDLPVIDDASLRRSTREDHRSTFADDVWWVYPFARKDVVRNKTASFASCPATLRDAVKRAVWCALNLTTPIDTLERTTGMRSKITLGTALSFLHEIRMFARWADSRGHSQFADIGAEGLQAYAEHLRDGGLSRAVKQRRLFAVTRLWLLAPYLPSQDRIPQPPWEQEGLEEIVGAADWHPENTTPPIHPQTLSPLLVWALRFVDDFSRDILTALADKEELKASIPERMSGSTQAARDYYDSVRAAQGSLPGYRSRRGGVELAAQYLAAKLGLPEDAITRSDCADIPLAQGAPLSTPIRGTVEGQPWLPAIDYYDTDYLRRLLATACLIVVAYLSGMRSEEARSLTRGCCTPLQTSEGRPPRYVVSGLHFKGAVDQDGNTIPSGAPREHPWIVIAPVARAINVMEQLHSHELLFCNEALTVWTRYHPGGATDLQSVNRNITLFAAWCNGRAAALQRPQDHIPADPEGAVTIRRFRRTLAWFIYRRPAGRVALAIQYGHLRGHVTDGYGSRVSQGLREVFPMEEAYAIADTLNDAAERLQGGEQVSGPAAERFIAGVREYSAQYQGQYLTPKQAAKLRRNPALRIYDNGEQMLACCYDATKALCHPENQRTPDAATSPDLTRCVPGCSNGARTDRHGQQLEAELARRSEEAESPLTPLPLRERHRQRSETLRQALEEHERTKRAAGTWPGHAGVAPSAGDESRTRTDRAGDHEDDRPTADPGGSTR